MVVKGREVFLQIGQIPAWIISCLCVYVTAGHKKPALTNTNNTHFQIKISDKEKRGKLIMRKSIKNFVIGAVMAATALTASTAAFAGQFVQTDMNFRSGPTAGIWSDTTDRPVTSTAETLAAASRHRHSRSRLHSPRRTTSTTTGPTQQQT